MAKPWSIQVFERQQLVYTDDFEGPVELGRQREPSEAV